MRWLFGLPGRGDTAFAGIAQWAEDENTYQIMNYTNDPARRDVWWVKGQLSPSMIYHLQPTIDGVEQASILSELPAGVYTLQVQAPERSATMRVMRRQSVIGHSIL